MEAYDSYAMSYFGRRKYIHQISVINCNIIYVTGMGSIENTESSQQVTNLFT